MKKFRVSVKIDDKAIKDAKDILYASMFRKQQVIDEFNNRYGSFVYSGQFTAGGWFRIVSTAKSSEAMEFSTLEREATHKTEIHSSAAFSGYSVTAGDGVNLGSSSQINTQKEGILLFKSLLERKVHQATFQVKPSWRRKSKMSRNALFFPS